MVQQPPVSTDILIIGAGVVGLAIARLLAQQQHSVVVLEQGDQIGTGISSRNSEVIHAGLYYPAGSLKATSCVRGNRLLYDYCQQHNIAHRRCSKLVVAQPSQLETLDALLRNAHANGVEALEPVSRQWCQAHEPWLKAKAALLSHHTGIVDSHQLMASLQQEAEQQGALICLRHSVRHADASPYHFGLTVEGPDGCFDIACQRLINAAGLGAVGLAQQLLQNSIIMAPEQKLAKGNYFSLTTEAPTQRLIYPLPETHGLGIHLTLDVAGKARFGPDVEWIDHIDYTVTPQRQAGFLQAIHRYWPGLKATQLIPAYAGIRPKLWQQGKFYPDFLLQTAAQHHIGGLVNLLGIESPGLTAALALAEQVAKAVND